MDIARAAKLPAARGRAWLGLAIPVAVAAGLRLWRLDRNGSGNPYYAACVRSMMASWRNFFFISFDPTGFVTVDKPPVALWVQGAFTKLFGFGGLHLLLPQAIMGVLTVWVLHRVVRRVSGEWAAFLAALVLAATPVAVAVDRDNLPDSALVLSLVLAAWALLKATETGRWGPLLASAALIGVGFNVKMLAAYIVVPPVILVYVVGVDLPWRAILLRLLGAAAVLAAVSLSWSAAVDLTPRSMRPYMGGSRTNSALELALGYNGLSRVVGGAGMPGGPPRGGGAPPPGFDPANLPPGFDPANLPFPPPGFDPANMPPPPPGFDPANMPFPPPPGMMGPGGGGPPGTMGPGGPNFAGAAGPLRFLNKQLAGQITWLFPLGLVGAIVGLAAGGPIRLPVDPSRRALLLWSGWLATHVVVFSLSRGIIHSYYLTAIAPALAALVGMGTVSLWESYRRGGWQAALLPVALVGTAAMEAYIVRRYPSWSRYLGPVALGGAGLSAAALATLRLLPGPRGDDRRASAALALGLAAVLAAPTAWALTPVLAKGNNMLPEATPDLLRPGGGGMMGMAGGPFGPMAGGHDKLVAFLKANHRGERYLMASTDLQMVAPIIIDTGLPIIATGGFVGGDPILTKESIAGLVDEGKLRYVMLGGRGGRGGPGGGGPPGMGPGGPFGGGEVAAWVREHGKVVEPELWRDPPPKVEEPPAGAVADPFMARMRRMGGPGGMMRLYDCRPPAEEE